MGESFKKTFEAQLAGLLLSGKRRSRYRKMLAALAVAVCLCVGAGLRMRGEALAWDELIDEPVAAQEGDDAVGADEGAQEGEGLQASLGQAVDDAATEALSEADAATDGVATADAPDEEPAQDLEAAPEAAAEGPADPEQLAISAGELTYEGDGYTVRISYPAESEIPAGTELVVRELAEGTDEYDEYAGRAAAVLSGEEDAVAPEGASAQIARLLGAFDTTSLTKVFDIQLVCEDELVEPDAEHPVSVEVTFVDADAQMVADEGAEAHVVHFAEAGTEVISDIDMTTDGDAGAVTFAYEQGSFSMSALTMMQGCANGGWTSASNGYQLVFRYGYPATTAAQGAPVFELQYNGAALNGPALDATTGSWPGEAGYPHTHGASTGYMDGIIDPGTTIQDLLFALSDSGANTQAAIRGIQIILYDTYEVGATGEAWGFNKNGAASNFLKTITITRGAGFSDTMIVNNADMTVSDPRTLEPGRLMIHNTVIDNATGHAASSDPYKRDIVAVRCNEGSLFMMGRELEKGQTYARAFNNGIVNTNSITMSGGVWLPYFSASIINSNDAGHGTGVLLSNTSGGTGHLPNHDYCAPDVTYAERYGGSVETFLESYIEGQYMGVDSQYGKLRLKDATNPIRNNTIDVNLAYGNSISKWTNDVSGIYSNPIDIVLEDIARWKSGDVVMDTGKYWAPALTVSPVVPNDINVFNLNRTGLTSQMGLEYYYGSGQYPYPVIRFFDGVVYNERTGQWYKTLYDAVTPGQQDVAGQATSIQDGDSIVFYGSTSEDRQVVINYDLTITAADSNDTLLDGVTQDAHGRQNHADPYVAQYVNANAQQRDFIVVSAGKTVTFGGNDDTTQGGLVLDAHGHNSAILNYGTVNLKTEVTVANGSYGVIQSGEEHLYEGALFSGNTVDHYLVSDGAVAGNHYITLETRTPNGGNVVTNSLGAPATQYNGRDVVVAGTTDLIDTTLSATYLAQFTLTDKDAEYDYVYTVNGGPSGERVLELKQKATITVRVIKVDELGAPLNGAGFTLYKVEGGVESAYALGNETNPHTTAGQGTTEMSVREGSFVLRETGVPAGYDGAADASFTVTNLNGTLTLSGTGFSLVSGTTDTYQVTRTNTRKTVQVTLAKVDAAGSPISGVTFGLDSQATTHTTGASGTVSLGTFEYGSQHTLHETWNAVAHDYQQLHGDITLDVDATTGALAATAASGDSVVVTGDATTGWVVTVTNRPNTVQVRFVKVDETGSVALPGATFATSGLATGDPSLASGANGVLASGGTSVWPITVGSTVTLTETVAPDGYNLLTSSVTVSVSSDPTHPVSSSQGLSWVNGPDAGGVFTVKVSNTSGVELPQAGGPGTTPFAISGFAIVCAALAYGFASRRTREGRSQV